MPSSRSVQCPSCGSRIPAEDMNLQTMAARCLVCQTLVDLRPEAATGGPDGASPQPGGPGAQAAILPVPLPPLLSVSTVGDELHIERRWYSCTTVFLTVFCIMWFGFLAIWYAMAFAVGNVVMMLFPLLHVAVGLVIAYTNATMYVNRTRIVAGRGHLTVRHGPLPWPGNRDLPTISLEQLYCEENISRSRNGTSVSYSVLARTTDGKQIKLVTGLSDRDQALYIEQEIERHLKIVDQHVAGGIRR